MNLASFKIWLSKPTNINGIGATIGVIAGLVAHVFTHDTSVAAAAGGSAFALVHLVLPDNSGAASSVEKLVTDTVNAIVQKHIAASIPMLTADALAVVQGLATAPAPTVAPVPAPVTA